MCRRKKCWIKEEFYLHNTNMSPHLCQAGEQSVLCAQMFALMSTTCSWTNRSHYQLERSDGFVETNCSLSLFLFLFFVLSIVRIQPRNRLRKKKRGRALWSSTNFIRGSLKACAASGRRTLNAGSLSHVWPQETSLKVRPVCCVRTVNRACVLYVWHLSFPFFFSAAGLLYQATCWAKCVCGGSKWCYRRDRWVALGRWRGRWWRVRQRCCSVWCRCRSEGVVQLHVDVETIIRGSLVLFSLVSLPPTPLHNPLHTQHRQKIPLSVPLQSDTVLFRGR